MDNQCANIFSTHATVYESHSVKFAFIERDNIFLHVYPQLSFLSFVCVSFFSPPPKLFPTLFFPQLVLFFLFLQGEKSFFYLGGVVTLHKGGCLYFIQSLIVLCFLDSFFSLILYCVYLLFIELSLLIRDKKGEIQMKCGNFVCFVQGRYIDCL